MDSEFLTFLNFYGRIQKFEFPCWTAPGAEGVIGKPGDAVPVYISTGREPKRKEEIVNGRPVVRPTIHRGETPPAAFPALEKGVSGVASSLNQTDNVLLLPLVPYPPRL